MSSRAVALVTAIAAAAGVAVGACGARTVAPNSTWQLGQQRRDEITALWTQVRDWRREAHMDLEPESSQVLAMGPTNVRVAAAVCPADHVPPPACDDVCGLADAICENAEAICDIASQLDDDPWARAKCDSSKASCREAQVRCCACQPVVAEPAP